MSGLAGASVEGAVMRKLYKSGRSVYARVPSTWPLPDTLWCTVCRGGIIVFVAEDRAPEGCGIVSSVKVRRARRRSGGVEYRVTVPKKCLAFLGKTAGWRPLMVYAVGDTVMLALVDPALLTLLLAAASRR